MYSYFLASQVVHIRINLMEC
uniref:Uncharacterized protein n=1 Tax=Arundo donax TaxID=35708 RepID=A0A0A9BE60_ARUDO